MPIYQFTCSSCNHITEEFMHSTRILDSVVCEVCGKPAKRNTVYTVNVKIGSEFNSKPRGKVIEEKNNALKKQYSGYSYEQQSVKDKVNAEVARRVDTGGGS